MERSRNHGRVEPFALEGFLALLVPLYGRAFGRPALTDDRGDLPLPYRIDEHEPFPSEAVEILLDDAAHEKRGDTGIESVSAPLQYLHGRRRRQRVARGNPGISSRDRGPLGRVNRLGRKTH